ncbi:oligoendopeptidase F [soil metagenome]
MRLRFANTFALLPVIFGVVLTAQAAESAETPADRWKLDDLYATPAAWDADAARLESQMPEFAKCKGHLGDSAVRLKQCLDLQADMTKRYYRMTVYSGEQLAQDTGANASITLNQRAELLGNRLDQTGSFVDPEILRIGAKKIARFIASEPGLKPYRFPLDRTLRAAPHTLDDAGETLVSQFGLMNDTGDAAYTMLGTADIPWPRFTLASGEEITLDQSAFSKYRESPVRNDRKRVMDTFFGTWKTYERSLGVMLAAQVKQDTVYSKVRKYPDSLARALDRDRIPAAVYDTLIAQTRATLPTLHRYLRLRAKMLGITDMQLYDIYRPLVEGDYKFPLARAKQLTLEAVAPLGAEYVGAMSKGMESRWMDAYPRPRKQSGAHMAGDAYDVHPYVLMNYNDDYDSVSTLAHEWGHAMHTLLSSRTQPFVTSNYATFVAEIASTFNEALLMDRMLASAKSDEERLYYLGTALENLRGTFYSQSMFAEFEREIHARADRGEPLTGDAMSKAYCQLLRAYDGEAEGVMKIDDAYCIQWAYIPHFYNSFYVYQYATSIAASSLFADRVAAGEPCALQRYLTLLHSGSSDYPYELVKKAGVDLASPAPYQALAARMNRIMDEIEAILKKRS